jgi:hypothetical protein
MGVARVVKSIQSFIAKSGVVLSFVTKSINQIQRKKSIIFSSSSGGGGEMVLLSFMGNTQSTGGHACPKIWGTTTIK